MHCRADRQRPLRRAFLKPADIEAIDQALRKFNEGFLAPVAAVKFFDVARVELLAKIDAAPVDVRKRAFESHPLLLHGVAAVVDQNVYAGIALLEALPESRVGLVPNLDEEALISQLRTAFID